MLLMPAPHFGLPSRSRHPPALIPIPSPLPSPAMPPRVRMDYATDPCARPLRSLRLGCAGEVESTTIGGMPWSCAADCPNPTCAVTIDTFFYGTRITGTLPDAIGNLSCRSKITHM